MEGPGSECFSGTRFLGDKRLEDRLFETFNRMAQRPVGTLPQKLVKRAELVGGYRMFNNPKVTHRALLDAHRPSCLERLEGHQGKVLLLHGYVLNPKTRPPGWIILWRGYIRLEDMCEGVRLMRERCVQT